MAKVVFWIVVVFLVLFVLRLLNVASAKRRRKEAGSRPAGGATTGDPMVRCVRCGLFLPKAEAKPAPGGFVCGDGRCLERR